jgi:hypothetical protein
LIFNAFLNRNSGMKIAGQHYPRTLALPMNRSLLPLWNAPQAWKADIISEQAQKCIK